MKEVIRIGRQQQILEIPAEAWRKHLASAQQHGSTRLNFMTSDHHRVRNFVVSELPRNNGKPLSVQNIAERLHLPLSTVSNLLADLERHLFFLVRNAAGEVNWAFPVTSEKTAHHLNFSTGERIFGAWAEDAIATPFVQGRLRNEQLAVEVETACAHCGQQLHVTLDSELHWSVREHDANPLLFEPDVDWQHFEAPNIIHDYWNNSLFFWSEEHARAFRRNQQQVDGVYLTLEQAVYSTGIAQSALFGFE